MDGFVIPRNATPAPEKHQQQLSSPTPSSSFYHHHQSSATPASGGHYGPASSSTYTPSAAAGGGPPPGGRKPKRNKPIDPTSGIMLHIHGRPYQMDFRDQPILQPHSSYFKYLGPPAAHLHNPIASLPLFHLRSIIIRDKEKQKGPIYVGKWDPTGRRLLTGSESGYLVVIQGTPIKTWMAHDNAIKTMTWSSNGNFMLTGSRNGIVKYWAKLNSVSAYDLKAHDGEVTSVSFAPSDAKFVSSSDDQTLKLWDFNRHEEEASLQGHTWDIKCAEWHPHKALIASCSKDSTVRLWDPRTHECINTLYGHKSQVFKVAFNSNGRWLLSGGQDALIKVWDLRMMVKDVATLRGHRREISSMSWHPFHETLLVSGDKEGALLYWLTDLSDRPQAEVYGHARDRAIWDVSWHPLGHVLATVGHDHMCKFWARNRPGDPMLKDANEYEQASLIGGTRPLLDESLIGSSKERGEEGAAAALLSGSSSSTPTLGGGEIELPGIGKMVIKDKTLVSAVGPNSLSADSVRANIRDQNLAVGIKRPWGEMQGGGRGHHHHGPREGFSRTACRRCGQEGHYAHECPNKGDDTNSVSSDDRGGRGGGGRGRGRGRSFGRGGFDGDRGDRGDRPPRGPPRPLSEVVCHVCGENGHYKVDCPKLGGAGGGSGRRGGRGGGRGGGGYGR